MPNAVSLSNFEESTNFRERSREIVFRQTTVSPSPRPTSRGKSRRSLKRFINTSLLLFGDSDAGFWAELSDEELKDRLAHVLLKPQGERAGFKKLLESDLLESFVTGDIGLEHPSSSSAASSTSGFISAASLLNNMWRRVNKSLRPLILRECRRVHRLQISDPEAVRNRSFFSSAEFLMLSILNGSIVNRLQARLAFEAGEEFFSAISSLRLEENIAVNVGSGFSELVTGVTIRILDYMSVTMLCAAASFYNIGVKCVDAPFDESERGLAGFGARRPPVDVTVYEKPARTREARQERATVTLLCKQLSSKLLPADYDSIADPDPEEECNHAMSSAGDDSGDGDGGGSGILAPADFDVAIKRVEKDVSSIPWGLVPDLISLHVRTLSEQTFGQEREQFKSKKRI
jgi:hypothetical protein